MAHLIHVKMDFQTTAETIFHFSTNFHTLCGPHTWRTVTSVTFHGITWSNTVSGGLWKRIPWRDVKFHEIMAVRITFKQWWLQVNEWVNELISVNWGGRLLINIMACQISYWTSAESLIGSILSLSTKVMLALLIAEKTAVSSTWQFIGYQNIQKNSTHIRITVTTERYRQLTVNLHPASTMQQACTVL